MCENRGRWGEQGATAPRDQRPFSFLLLAGSELHSTPLWLSCHILQGHPNFWSCFPLPQRLCTSPTSTWPLSSAFRQKYESYSSFLTERGAFLCCPPWKEDNYFTVLRHWTTELGPELHTLEGTKGHLEHVPTSSKEGSWEHMRSGKYTVTA